MRDSPNNTDKKGKCKGSNADRSYDVVRFRDLSACAAPDSVEKINEVLNADRSYDAVRFRDLSACAAPDSVEKNKEINADRSEDAVMLKEK